MLKCEITRDRPNGNVRVRLCAAGRCACRPHQEPELARCWVGNTRVTSTTPPLRHSLRVLDWKMELALLKCTDIRQRHGVCQSLLRSGGRTACSGNSQSSGGGALFVRGVDWETQAPAHQNSIAVPSFPAGCGPSLVCACRIRMSRVAKGPSLFPGEAGFVAFSLFRQSL